MFHQIIIATAKNILEQICDYAIWFYPCSLCHRRILGLANPDLHHCFSLQVDYKLDANQILCNPDEVNTGHCLKNHTKYKFL